MYDDIYAGFRRKAVVTDSEMAPQPIEVTRIGLRNGARCTRYSAATSFRGGVRTTGAKMAAFNDATRLSSGAGP
jgi:hypothetical protein